jgi:hypothetical protein
MAVEGHALGGEPVEVRGADPVVAIGAEPAGGAAVESKNDDSHTRRSLLGV